MKIFLTQEEKLEFKQLRNIEKLNIRRMTEEELRKIEDVEKFCDMRRSLFVSLIALFISLVSLISKAVL